MEVMIRGKSWNLSTEKVQDRSNHVMHTENPGHETDHQELGSGHCHHYIHKPNPVYQIEDIGGEHNPSELSARIPDYR
jgi:hypothetical protein